MFEPAACQIIYLIQFAVKHPSEGCTVALPRDCRTWTATPGKSAGTRTIMRVGLAPRHIADTHRSHVASANAEPNKGMRHRCSTINPSCNCLCIGRSARQRQLQWPPDPRRKWRRPRVRQPHMPPKLTRKLGRNTQAVTSPNYALYRSPHLAR